MLAFQFLTFLLISRIFTSYGFANFLSILLHTNQFLSVTITSIYMGFKETWINYHMPITRSEQLPYLPMSRRFYGPVYF